EQRGTAGGVVAVTVDVEAEAMAGPLAVRDVPRPLDVRVARQRDQEGAPVEARREAFRRRARDPRLIVGAESELEAALHGVGGLARLQVAAPQECPGGGEAREREPAGPRRQCPERDEAGRDEELGTDLMQGELGGGHPRKR